MRNKPLFTQKHYEYVMQEMSRAARLSLADRGITREQLEGAAEFLCLVFARDNPKFKRERFLATMPRRAS